MNPRGVSLIELLAAITILAMIIVPLSAALTTTYGQTVENKWRTEAGQIAREAMERVKEHLSSGGAESDIPAIEQEFNQTYGDRYAIDVEVVPRAVSPSQSIFIYQVTVKVAFLDQTPPRHEVKLISLVQQP